MSEVTRETDIDDSFTVLDEINELPDEILNKDDFVENDDVSEALLENDDVLEDPIENEHVEHVEKNGDIKLEDVEKADALEECDTDLCEEAGDEYQVLTTEDNNVETSVNNDKSVSEKDETCLEEQPILEESGVENDEIIKQTEVSVNRDESENLQDLDLSECVDEDVPEKAEKDVTHPYLYIIETFEYEKDQLNLTTVGNVKTLEETPFHMITTRTGLMKMLQSLRNVKEIALDVVKASREFVGIICLIIISTRDADYCIDAVKLQHDLLLLTEIFINPKILKIVLRARSVLACLQQTLHLYMINIFDIQRARSALMIGEGNSWTINNILKTEYNFERGQLKNPDLRKRPLPESYKNFYRAGPHYFIYVYHDYKNRLILKDAELYKKFLDDCRNMCKIIFSDMDSMSYQALEEELKNHHKCELELLKQIYDWRSSVAQKKNIKCDMVLHKGGVLNLVRQLPTQDEEIFNVAKSVHVKEDVEKIKGLINEMKIKHNIRRKRPRNKKTITSPLFQGPLRQGGIQQKRKFSDQTEVPNKQKRVDQGNDIFKSTMKKKQNEKFASNQNKQKQSPQSKSMKKPKQNIPYQNKNLQPWVDKQNAIGSFFNSRDFSTNNKRKRFQPPGNRYTDTFNTLMNQSDNSNPVFLNTTSVPSSFTFQTNSSRSHIGSNRDDLLLSLGNFGQSPRNMRQMNEPEDEEETLYRSLVDLKQARDNIRMQSTNYSGNFKPPRFQDLNAIDQKINTLERRIQQTQARNQYEGNVGSSGMLYTRRY